MREVISVQIGQYGNRAGHNFWKQLFAEHGLDPTGTYAGSSPDTQLAHIGSYFDESPGKSEPRYAPRAVCVDLDPSGTDWVDTSEIGGCFRAENFILGEYGTGSCWARGHYDQGENLMIPIMDCLRREIERCDSFQGFQFVHALGGGTGSGLGTKIISSLADIYYNIRLTFSLLPSPAFGYSSVVEPYNTVLTLHQLIENASSSVCVDEGAMWRRARAQPWLGGVDQLMANMMSDVTACNRFTSPVSGDLLKLETSLVMFPRMKFFVPGHALPTHSPSLYPYTNRSVPILIEQLFDPRNLLATCNLKNGKYIAIAPFFRGELNANEVEEQMANFKNANYSDFMEWVPNNIQSFITNSPIQSPLPSPTSLSHLFTPSSYSPSPSSPSSPSSPKPSLPLPSMSATYLGNTTAIQDLFSPILSDFDELFRRKAFLNPFINYGSMDEMEFVEAQSNVQDLLFEYDQYAKATEDDFGEDEGVDEILA